MGSIDCCNNIYVVILKCIVEDSDTYKLLVYAETSEDSAQTCSEHRSEEVQEPV